MGRGVCEEGGWGGGGNKGPSLIVGVTFCTSGDPVPARPVPASPSHPRVLTWLPGTQLIASPYLETLLDFDGVYLGGQLTIPFLLPTAGIFILNSTPYPEAPANVGAGGKVGSPKAFSFEWFLFPLRGRVDMELRNTLREKGGRHSREVCSLGNCVVAVEKRSC